jgi:pimeloyl-ACP methyl ester carboxylesterase
MMARNDVGGTSSKNLMHWIQDIRSGEFRQFDYGKDENEQRYGNKSPPQYDMSDFKNRLADVDILLFVGTNDYLVAADDFKSLTKNLPSSSKVVSIQDYNHLDYMWGNDANAYVNEEIFSFLEAKQL